MTDYSDDVNRDDPIFWNLLDSQVGIYVVSSPTSSVNLHSPFFQCLMWLMLANEICLIFAQRL